MKNITISTKFFDDERIIAISGEFGIAGELCALKLLCEIRKNGYFLEWSTLKQNFLARTFGVDTDTLRAIVNRLAEYGFFSAAALKKHKVLTTEELQRVYFRPRTRRRDISNIPYLIITLEQWIPEETKAKEVPTPKPIDTSDKSEPSDKRESSCKSEPDIDSDKSGLVQQTASATPVQNKSAIRLPNKLNGVKIKYVDRRKHQRV